MGVHRQQSPGIIPAYAGNTNIMWNVNAPAGDHPRLRGEHLHRKSLQEGERGSSPLTRGTPRSEAAAASGGGIIPAYAGNTTSFIARSAERRDHPRLRGEHHCPGWMFTTSVGSSPLTRGTHHLPVMGVLGLGIIPAYAGNTSDSIPAGELSRDHPRLRGEHSLRRGTYPHHRGSSPLTRGTPYHHAGSCEGLRIIPAYAGNTPAVRGRRRWTRDHPRLRGEHSILKNAISTSTGSSPLTRGTRQHSGDRLELAGIIPAYAGNTPPPCPICPIIWDHPRLRGEHSGKIGASSLQIGSSPLTRGTPARPADHPHEFGIIPAYAGNTTLLAAHIQISGDHPRLRGEHSWSISASTCCLGSSPLTRGTLAFIRQSQHRLGIIPAYAGNTRSRGIGQTCGWDHPRLRGEHFNIDFDMSQMIGSSPLTRGTLR